MRGDVARHAGIVVVAPGAAEIGGLFEDAGVLDSRFVQLDRCADTGQPSTEDDDLVVLRLTFFWIHDGLLVVDVLLVVACAGGG